jgi:hypothetical protein
MGILHTRLAKVGEGGDLLGGDRHQVVALQREFHRAADTLGHQLQQLFS